MKLSSYLAISIMALSPVLLGQQAQRSERVETGVIQGTITRSGTSEPLPEVQVRLVDPTAMQEVVKALTQVNGGPLPTNFPEEQLLQFAQEIVGGGLGIPANNIDNANLRTALDTLQKTVLTDNSGRFVFNNLRPGSYTVRAQRTGFFGGTANNSSNATATAETSVAAGRTTTVDLSMVAGGTISGRVTSNGVPLVSTNVQAYALGYENGYQVLRPVVSKTTDDRGDYRLFYLPPGEYIVAVIPRQNPIRVTVLGTPATTLPGFSPTPATPVPPSGEQALRTFYPGTVDAGSAIGLTVQGASEVAGIDIAMQTAKTYKVSGEIRTVVSPDVFIAQQNRIQGTVNANVQTRPPALPNVTAEVGVALHDPDVPDDAGGRNLGGAIPVITAGKAVVGRFEVTGVTPGSYDWRAYFNQPTEDGSFVTTAIVPVEVRNADVENVQLEIPALVRVNGVVTIDGRTPGETPVRLSLQVEGSGAKRPGYINIANRIVAAKKEDGTFTIPGVMHGRFRVLFAGGLPPHLYIADVRQGASSVFDGGFEIGKDPLDKLQVMLRSGAGMIEGVVRDAARRPVASATVALVPPPGLRSNRARFQTATSDASGRFTVTNIIPGDYRLFAWPDAPGGAYFNARFLSRHEDHGRAVSVGPSSSASIDLVAIQ